MRDNLYYYIYTILALNILLHSFFLRRLSDLLFFTQLIALVLFALVSIYFVFSYEVLESKPYFFTLVFFALVTANSIVVYYISSDISMLFLSLAGIVGVYVTDVIIPHQRRPEIQTRVTSKKEALKKEFKGMEFGEPEV
ncbi:hypothetical protein GOV08_00870, partial [Candidatus Woesearchaeota archaeon]|nr:hypothetical protein [Candidatus Woesearchaeota archaeon]